MMLWPRSADSRPRSLTAAGIIGGICLVLAAAPCLAAQPADFVLRGGSVYTVDSTKPHATALAVSNGRIVYVGDDRGAQRFIGSATTVHELHGHMVLPGFHDSHVHPVTGGVSLLECQLEDDSTRAMVVAKIAECAHAAANTPWLRGRGWQLPVFPHANPSRQLLDSLVPDRPVFMEAADGHSAWVNTRALEVAGITVHTQDPPRGHIERDKTGAPSGTLREDPAMDLVLAHAPSRTLAENARGLERSIAMANRFGITSVIEADADSTQLAAFDSLDRAGTLTVRALACIHIDPALGVAQVPTVEALRDRYHGRLYRSTATKIYADGVIEAHTAALLEPYVDTHDRGPANLEPGAFDSLVVALDHAGFQVHVHAIGDRAVRMALDAMAAARTTNGARDSRHHIAHLEMIDTLDVARFAALGVYANFQPLWAFRDSYIRDLTEPVLGPERSRRLYPMGSVARAGGTIVAGSDWQVSSMNPLEAIQVAVTRRDWLAPAGKAWLPKERLTLKQAIAAYTINGARVAFQERETGSIAAGKAADLIVLDRDLFAIPPQEIHRAQVLLTMLDGRVVYRKSEKTYP